MSLWKLTLEEFGDRVAQGPVPAGVSVAAVAAAFAFRLLTMCLRVTGRQRDFSGDRARLTELAEKADQEAARMMEYADRDVAAYRNYLKHRKSPDAATAMRAAIEVPMEVARGAGRGLELCAAAAALVSAGVVPDLASAAALLASALRAAARSAEANAAALADRRLIEELAGERVALETAAAALADRVLAAARLRPLSSSRGP
jgi:formiminotetrahydrofolate cyclodeaminase